MNTIKIYLAEDGSIADLQKDFDLYQFEYQNKLLNVYVPLSICAGPFVDNNATTGYSCQIKMSALNAHGQPKLTAAFYMRFVKTLTQNGVQYALFERLLPYAFTIYSGVGVGAPQLSISVVNISVDMDNNEPVIDLLSITNTQTCPLDVNPSTQVQSEVPQDPSDLDALFALYSALETDMALKQNIDLDEDTYTEIGTILNSLVSLPVTIPLKVEPALLDLYARVKNTNLTDTTQTGQISQLRSDVDALQQTAAVGIRVIGTLTLTDQAPTQVDLNNFYTSQMGTAPHSGGDIIYVSESVTGGSDLFYICSWQLVQEQWSINQVTILEKGSNTEYGVIKGTYGDSNAQTNNILVDVSAGKITDVYVSYGGSWVSIKTRLETLQTTLDNILNGTTAVPKAIGDAAGDNIVSTYQTKVDGASKSWSMGTFAPKVLNDVFYFNFTDNTLEYEFTNNANPKQAIITQLQTYVSLGTFVLTLPQDIQIGSNNGMHALVNIESDKDLSNTNLKLNAAYYDTENSTWMALATAQTISINLVAGQMLSQEIGVYFDQLNDLLTLPKDTQLRLALSISTEQTGINSGNPATVSFYARTANKSKATLDKLTYIEYVISTNDYNQLSNKPIIQADLSQLAIADASTGVVYKHIGGTDSTFTSGWLYYKNGSAATAYTCIMIDESKFLTDVKLEGEANPVPKSSGVAEIPTATLQSYAVVDIDDITDATPTLNSTNLVQSGGVASELSKKQDKVAVDTTSTSPITLANNTSFRLGTISALTISAPNDYALDFECEVVFTADTGISMTYSAVSPTWTGDDVSGGVFTPVDGKTYNILFFNNATAVATPSIQAIVRGVS